MLLCEGALRDEFTRDPANECTHARARTHTHTPVAALSVHAGSGPRNCVVHKLRICQWFAIRQL